MEQPDVDDGVEGPPERRRIERRRIERIPHDECRREPPNAGLLDGLRHGPCREVDPDDLVAATCEVQRVVAGAATDVEHGPRIRPASARRTAAPGDGRRPRSARPRKRSQTRAVIWKRAQRHSRPACVASAAVTSRQRHPLHVECLQLRVRCRGRVPQLDEVTRADQRRVVVEVVDVGVPVGGRDRRRDLRHHPRVAAVGRIPPQRVDPSGNDAPST